MRNEVDCLQGLEDISELNISLGENDINLISGQFKLLNPLSYSYSSSSSSYSTINAVYIADNEILNSGSILLDGIILPGKELEVYDFLNIPNARYKLTITKNGIQHFKYGKRGNQTNIFRTKGINSKFRYNFLYETQWLRLSDWITILSPDDVEGGSSGYNNGLYNEALYGIFPGSATGSYTFIPGGTTQVYFQLEGTTVGSPVELIVNGNSIKTSGALAAGKTLTYGNLPFYFYATLDGTSVIPNLDPSTAHFSLTFNAREQNTITVVGLKNVKFRYVEGRVIV